MNRVIVLTTAEQRAELAATWAARLADGQVPEDQQAEFQAWLDADPANGQALDEIVGAWRMVEHYAASAQVMALREAALASARRSLRRREQAWPPRQIAWALMAATLLLAVAGVGTWAWLMPRTYETGVGERQVIALSDGSKLSLDAATVVKVSYTRENRRLWLERGRARFDVARNPLRPFSVTAGNDVVVATGTAFSVELVQKQVRVVLYEGHVMVLDRATQGVRRTVAVAGRRLPADQLLTPGRELILPIAAPTQIASIAPVVVTAADPVRSLSWEAGQLVFEDERLGLVVERMNRYAQIPLAIGDEAAANLRISGVFRAGDTEALVQGLGAAFDVKARSGPNGVELFGGSAPRPAG
ncbi:MAG: FecR domain-containing protein [Alphaproteobacteria bacterium]|nr:FecR domain-containing protein [Alphaproteobacteria bacterium]MBU1516767.1 FecR domain-containing protein [Alphaproteobacteria bacterium]MBU2092461.1 FecR domain-containing protein [Alphaproteobacteria bacterium]MBU2152408.1 FecR domain-containing protein [Alphaproteobacteria bacterium]MBU2305619.1 FecR domain-containing protein [Alphaproteobacteria bacterium]